MNNYRLQLEKFSKENELRCPYCKSTDIGVDNWGMFVGVNDWFYYCKKCDDTFGLGAAKFQVSNSMVRK